MESGAPEKDEAMERSSERSSERTCIVTRRQAPPEAMIRFVRAPDGAVAPDIRSRLPGRGVWVTARADVVAEAARKQMFARGLKAGGSKGMVAAPPSLALDVDRLLEADCLQMLAMANKAGLVTTGFGKVCAALEKNAVAVLIEASDGSDEGKRKLAQAARRAAGETGARAEAVVIFSSMQLDLALGRTNVIHAALARGGPSTAFLERRRRLEVYRGATAANAEPEFPRASAESTTNVKRTGRDGPGSDVG